MEPTRLTRLHSAAFAALAFLGLSTVLASSALAEEEEEGWRIGVGITGGFQFSKAKAGIETSDVQGPVAQIPPLDPVSIQQTIDGTAIQTAGYLLGGLEFTTPTLFDDLPGRPRLFVRTDVGAIFGQEDDVTRSGDPADRLSIAPILLETGTSNLPTDAVLGQGTRLSINTERLTYSAGIGVTLEKEIFGQIVRFKPSAEYMVQKVKASGIVSRAVVETGPNEGQVGDPNALSDFRHILIQDRQQRFFHAAGVGLEVETDAGEAGPFTVSVFLSGQALNILGGREITFAANNRDTSDPRNADETADFRLQMNDWTYRAGVGVRFRWSPDRRRRR